MIAALTGLLLALSVPVAPLGLELGHPGHKYVARAEPECPELPTSNGGRKIAIVIDSSGSNYQTDPNDLRIAAGKELNSLLITKAQAGGDRQPDLVTVVDFDWSAEVIYALGDPASATFEGIDASGGTYIAKGVAAAIDELTKEEGGAAGGRAGIVVLTDGNAADLDELIEELGRAKGLNIRVAFGFLSPEAPTDASDLLNAILSTGGIYSTISSAEAQDNFVNLVVAHGLTAVDKSGTNGTVALYPGLSVAGNVSASTGPESYSYIAQAGEKLNFTVNAISGQNLDLTLRSDAAKDGSNTTATTDSSGSAGFRFTVATAGEYTVDVSTTNATSGLFTISLNSSAATGNHTSRCKPSKLRPSTNSSTNVTHGTNGTNQRLTLFTGDAPSIFESSQGVITVAVFSLTFFMLSSTGILP